MSVKSTQNKLNILYGYKLRIDGMKRRKESPEKINDLLQKFETLKKEIEKEGVEK